MALGVGLKIKSLEKKTKNCYSLQSCFDIYCTWLLLQIYSVTRGNGETLRWSIPSMGKHLLLCFVNDMVLSFSRRHVVWLQFFIPISTPVSSQRITLIEVKWEEACFSKEWMWSRRSETTVRDKWEPTSPRPVMTRSMNGEFIAFMTKSTGILKMLPHIEKWMVPCAPLTTEWQKSSPSSMDVQLWLNGQWVRFLVSLCTKSLICDG